MGKLIYVWSALDAFYLATGALAIVFSLLMRMTSWRVGQTPGEHTLRSLVISDMNTSAALVLGVMIVLSWLVGMYGAVTGLRRGKRQTAGLLAFNWSLVAVVMATTVVGCTVWFFTLQPRAEFFAIWQVQSQVVQQFLQDSLQCCGYFDASRAGGFLAPGGFCASVAAQTNTTAVQGCVTPITAFEDVTLNNVFSTIFGFVAVQVALFLATCCLVNVRDEEERFRLIDEKRGRKGGFV